MEPTHSPSAPLREFSPSGAAVPSAVPQWAFQTTASSAQKRTRTQRSGTRSRTRTRGCGEYEYVYVYGYVYGYEGLPIRPNIV